MAAAPLLASLQPGRPPRSRTGRPTRPTGPIVGLTVLEVKLSQNYQSSGSSGGGPHDSGAPVFLGDTLVLAGSMFDGGDVAGVTQVDVMRFDEPGNHALISSFLD